MFLAKESDNCRSVTAAFQHMLYLLPQCTDNDTVAAVEKMSNDLQIFCKNKPLLQSPPIINKVSCKCYHSQEEMSLFR